LRIRVLMVSESGMEMTCSFRRRRVYHGHPVNLTSHCLRNVRFTLKFKAQGLVQRLYCHGDLGHERQRNQRAYDSK